MGKGKIITPKNKSKILNMTTNYDRLFFGASGQGIARYDIVRYPVFTKLNDMMISFIWRPKEVNLSQERKSFDSMSKAEQHIFTSNLKRQILLDSIQGRAPTLAFLPYCTDPSLENCITTWAFFETIHSESYTYILRAIYPDPSVVIEGMVDIKEIADCASSISKTYEDLIENPSKKNLYLALVSANALEAIRFYVSFACTFSLKERKFIDGSANIIKLIARDEAAHLSLVQNILKVLPQEDPEFIDIMHDNREEAQFIFQEAADQEKEWAKYLFSEGSMIGLNEKILCDYVDYLHLRRAKAIGLSSDVSYKGSNPIPWIENHLTSKNTQPALQETDNTSYFDGSILGDDIDLKKMSEVFNKKY